MDNISPYVSQGGTTIIFVTDINILNILYL